MTNPAHSVLLSLKEDEKLLSNMSAIVRIDNHLWLASDELTSVERLTQIDEQAYGNLAPFNLADSINLPFKENDDDEVDIEGMDYDGQFLWVVGSHSSKRTKIKDKLSLDDNLKRLKKVTVDGNRFILARIPLINGELKKIVDDNNEGLLAAQLEGDIKSNELTQALQKDEHLGAFLSIPSKENGFDIEGLAVHEDRVFLGLRGPVLRGISIILELALEQDNEKPSLLRLKQFDNGLKYKKHLLDLQGAGIRDLCFVDEDLYILAGPTMSNDGLIAVYKLPEGLKIAPTKVEKPEFIFEVPSAPGANRAEGLALYKKQENNIYFIVVYDTPDQNKRVGTDSIKADIFLYES